ncbi:ABC transporter substrate-binding protein [Flavobacteriaceae bacterium]|nr:ABC transporter substrate-binding protein [Flavobacteriaceae bacterium]
MNKIIVKIELLLIILLLNSCSNNNNPINKDHLVFKYNEHKNISSLDPAFAKDNADIWVINQLFNGLVEMDKDLNIIPSIAKKWSISDDGKIYTFNLKTNIKFHDHKLLNNRKVIAKDFTYSFDRVLDKKLASPGAWVLDKVQAYEAVNDSVFKITLKEPFNAFLGILSMKYCSVVPKEIVQHYGNDFRKNPIGTGPFKFKRWEENIKLVLRKNEHYFEKDINGNSLPFLEAVAITFIPEKQSEFLEFIQSNLDFISGLDESYKDEILNKNGDLSSKYSDNINIVRAPYLNTEYLGFYNESPNSIVKSKLIRKAINYGFDRDKMIKFLRNGIGVNANTGFIPDGLPGYSKEVYYKYNPELAKKLVRDYINTSGDENPTIKLTTTSNYLVFCEFIQKEIEKIGINIIVDVIPASSLKEAKANGKLDFFRASWVADYPDAQNYLSLYYSKNFAPLGPNYTHFSNDIYDVLYEESLIETRQLKKELLYKKMDSIIMEESIIVPLYYDEVIRFTHKNINNLGVNPINILDLRRVTKN